MATITIRDLDEGLNRRLRVQAAQHGRSMEEEARDILSRALGPAPAQREASAAQSTRCSARMAA